MKPGEPLYAQVNREKKKNRGGYEGPPPALGGVVVGPRGFYDPHQHQHQHYGSTPAELQLQQNHTHQHQHGPTHTHSQNQLPPQPGGDSWVWPQPSIHSYTP